MPALPPVTWSAAELNVSFSNIPHRRWLYGTYLIRGEITVLAAPGGAGKTALAIGMAVEIATGTELLGEKIHKAHDLKVLFINGEDGGTEIARRVWAFCLAHAHKIAGQNLDRLYVAGANDARVQRLSFLQTTDRNFSMLDQSGFEVLEAALETLRPDVTDPRSARCFLRRRQHERQRGDGAGYPGVEAPGDKVRLRRTNCSSHQKGRRTTVTPRRSVGQQPPLTWRGALSCPCR